MKNKLELVKDAIAKMLREQQQIEGSEYKCPDHCGECGFACENMGGYCEPCDGVGGANASKNICGRCRPTSSSTSGKSTGTDRQKQKAGKMKMEGRGCKNTNLNEQTNMRNKQTLTERFQELAGIVPLAEAIPSRADRYTDPEDPRKDDTNEERSIEISGEEMKEYLMQEGEMNEGIFTAIGGLIAILSAAGVTTAVELALEDPAIAEKYPKLTDLFGALKSIGNSGLTKGIK